MPVDSRPSESLWACINDIVENAADYWVLRDACQSAKTDILLYKNRAHIPLWAVQAYRFWWTRVHASLGLRRRKRFTLTGVLRQLGKLDEDGRDAWYAEQMLKGGDDATL